MLAALILHPLAQAGNVSATPGTFSGTIVFNAPVQPDSMTVDAAMLPIPSPRTPMPRRIKVQLRSRR
ncbi:MAG TPA: hypothetical protein VKE70_10990 [Candidatus Solibacter sp.]|nr:hypothetical protein [Candidatus Solibacter sp.]